MEVLRTENLKKIYQTPSGEVRALDGVSVSIEEGEFVAVIGSSGSGKTTLLNMLGGLDTPTEGDVIVRGKRLGGMKGEELTVFRRRNVGFVFQNYNLMPILSVKENITLPLKLDGMGLDRDFLITIRESDRESFIFSQEKKGFRSWDWQSRPSGSIWRRIRSLSPH